MSTFKDTSSTFYSQRILEYHIYGLITGLRESQEFNSFLVVKCRLSKILHPLSTPEEYWNTISMDFITGLRESQEFNSFLVVKCRLSKILHPLSTPEEYWNTISMDFIIGLRESQGFNSFLVVKC
eukprot:Awhi_evm1s11654